MRNKGIFTVFERKLPSGKRVFYYQCYDAKGRRQWAKSTGLTKKTEAVKLCMRLFKDGVLIPDQKAPLFADFSKGWWESDTCQYLKWRQLHDPLSKNTIYIHKNNLKNHIAGYFAKFRLEEISPEMIEAWLLSVADKGLKRNTVNCALKTLRLMLKEAVRQKKIKVNPCLEVEELSEDDATQRKILTVEEARKLFSANWLDLWENSVVFNAHRLAACTGLRIGELRGLKREFLFDDYISVAGQYGRFGYSPFTKTKHNRNISITGYMRQELEELVQANGDGYVFSEDGGKSPIAYERLNAQFAKALEKIGIDKDEKQKRNLTFHSWRHFANTLLRTGNVADSKVQSVTGHRTMKMTEHYTHFDTRQFTEVREVQAELLAFNKP